MNEFEKLNQKLLNHQSTWLVTGAAGFIGSNLVEALLNLKQKVIGLDNFSTGYKHNIDDVLLHIKPELKNNFIFIEGDIRSLETCKRAIKDVDYVLHQAALGSVPRSIKDPILTSTVNVDGFLNMLIAAKDEKVKRFVFASSSSVYGDSPILPKKENQIGNPLSPYAVSKYTNELYAKVFSNCYALETIGLRYFNVFGPRQDPKGAYAAVIPLWILGLMNEQPVFINGDGKTTRDFCYIDNVMQANLLAATIENKAAVNRAYNVAVSDQTTLMQLFEIICTNLNLSSKLQPVFRDFRAGDIRHSLADIEDIKILLGYDPKYAIKEGLRLTVDWYKTAIKYKGE